ncbi:MAG: zinc metalloprotease HtpX [Pseudomonadota bacterium]
MSLCQPTADTYLLVMSAAFFQDGHQIRERHRFVNRMHTTLLIGGSLLLLFVSVLLIFGFVGVIYAAFFCLFSYITLRRVGPSVVLKMYKARGVTPAQFPEGHAILNELAYRAGLQIKPKLFIVKSRMLNAFAVGRLEDSAIAVTDGLLHALTKRELAGVLAHEVSHIKNEDIKVMGLADAISRMLSMMSIAGLFALTFNVAGFSQVSWLGVAALIAAPSIGSILQLALSRTREFDADYGAAMLTGDPDGLSSALSKLEYWQRRRLEAMALPVGRLAEPSMLRSHPPTDQRIARLNDLKTSFRDTAPRRMKGPNPMRSVPSVGRVHRGILSNDALWHRFASESEPPPLPCDPSDADGSCARGNENSSDVDGRVRIRGSGTWW